MATKTPTKPAAKAAAKPAAKSAASTTTALAKRPNANVVSIREQLKAQAESMSERVGATSGNTISIKNGEFRLPNGVKTKEPIQLVVVDFVANNAFYPGKYDPNNIVPPVCIAIGTDPKQLVPSKNSPDLQSDTCKGCPMNEFGSDGNGKACKNQRTLAVLPTDANADDPMWRLVVPPTSTGNWDSYVRSVVNMFQMPPVSVITTVSFDESSDFPKLIFGEPQPNDNLEAHFPRQAEAMKMLTVEPDMTVGDSKPAKKTAARGRR